MGQPGHSEEQNLLSLLGFKGLLCHSVCILVTILTILCPLRSNFILSPRLHIGLTKIQELIMSRTYSLKIMLARNLLHTANQMVIVTSEILLKMHKTSKVKLSGPLTKPLDYNLNVAILVSA